MPLRVLDGAGAPPPRAGYPTRGNEVLGPLPATADVTIRRAQRFRLAPGEPVRWTFGAAGGTVLAGPDGIVTIPGLRLGTTWTTLVLER